jgi:hypothetical protein
MNASGYTATEKDPNFSEPDWWVVTAITSKRQRLPIHQGSSAERAPQMEALNAIW